MKTLNKIFLGLGMIGSIAAVIFGEKYGANLGTWGYVALIGFAALCALLLMAIPVIKFVKDNFDVEYDKESGLKIREQPEKV
jgi:high-affinity Fe2+/Pb2+ permease